MEEPREQNGSGDELGREAAKRAREAVAQNEAAAAAPRREKVRKGIAVVVGAVAGVALGLFTFEMGRVIGQTSKVAALATDAVASATPWQRY